MKIMINGGGLVSRPCFKDTTSVRAWCLPKRADYPQPARVLPPYLAGTGCRSNRLLYGRAEDKEPAAGGGMFPRHFFSIPSLTKPENKSRVGSMQVLRRDEDTDNIEPLLIKIHQEGWSEQLATRFEDRYGDKFRWTMVVYMKKMGFIQKRISPDYMDNLSTLKLELYENTVSDLWKELLDGLVSKYVKKARRGKVQQKFLPYIKGVIRHLLIANARKVGILKKQTPTELIRGINKAKKSKTKSDRIAWAKFCYGKKVKNALLERSGSKKYQTIKKYKNRLSDYFFEKFIPQQSEWISDTRGNIFNELMDRFIDSDLEDSINYTGKVSPYRAFSKRITNQAYNKKSEDQYLSELMQKADGEDEPIMSKPQREKRLTIWDQVVRGERIEQETVNGLLSQPLEGASNEEKSSLVLLLSVVELSHAGTEATRRNLKAALRYWFSQAGEKDRPHDFNPQKLEGAGLGELVGLHLTWPEAMESVGANPDDYSALTRTKTKLKEKYDSQWENLFETPAPPFFSIGGE